MLGVNKKAAHRLNTRSLAQRRNARARKARSARCSRAAGGRGTPLILGERETLFVELLTTCRVWAPLSGRCLPTLDHRHPGHTYKTSFRRRGACSRSAGELSGRNRHLILVTTRIVKRGRAAGLDDARRWWMAAARRSRVNAIIPPLAVDGPVLSDPPVPGRAAQAEDLVHAARVSRSRCRVPVPMLAARSSTRASSAATAGRQTTLQRALQRPSRARRIVTTRGGRAPAAQGARGGGSRRDRPRRVKGAVRPSAADYQARSACAPIASSSARFARGSARHAPGDEPATMDR